MLSPATGGVAATAALGAAALRLDSAVPFALGVYLLASAEDIHWVLLNRDAPRPALRPGRRREDFPGSVFTLYSD